VHPSGVKGTEFNQKAAQDGGIQYKSFPLGKVTRLQIARRIVRLIEQPRRGVFMSRLYDFPVALDNLFPGLVDFAVSTWVRLKRRGELRQYETLHGKAEPARYQGYSAGVPLMLLASALVFVFRAKGKGNTRKNKSPQRH
jgi:hypothetical protein